MNAIKNALEYVIEREIVSAQSLASRCGGMFTSCTDLEKKGLIKELIIKDSLGAYNIYYKITVKGAAWFRKI